MGFFGFGSDEPSLRQLNKTLTADNKKLSEDVKRLEKELKSAGEAYSDSIRTLKRENRIELEEIEDRYDADAADAYRAADSKVEEAEKAAEKKVKEAEAKVQNTELAVKKAVLEEKEKNAGAVSKVEIQLAKAQGETNAAKAEVNALNRVIKELVTLLEGTREDGADIAAELLEKLPKVDLSKFNVNVDVPAQAVTVNTTNSKKE